MPTSRKRNVIAIAGRLTAVTLSVALLAGCTGSRFTMGGDPAPVNPTGVTPAVSNQPVALVNVAGKATLAGVPLANATVKVFDALTNAPAAVISAGGGNVIAAGGGNVIAAGGANFVVLQAGGRPALQVAGQTFTTDAQGNFSLPLGNFKPGMAARIVVTAGGKTVTTLVSGSGKALQTTKAAYQVTQNAGGAGGAGLDGLAGIGAGLAGAQANTGVSAQSSTNNVNANINEYTHIANQLLWGYSKLTGSLNTESAGDIIDNGIILVNSKVMGELEAKITPSDANQFADADESGRMKDTASLNTFTKTAGLEDQVNQVVNTGRESVAKASENKANVVQTITLTKGDFAGSTITVAVNAGQLTFTNEKTGESFTVTLPTPPADQSGNEQPGTQQPEPQQQETSAGPNETEQTETNAGAFKPTVTTSYAGGNLTVTVSQPGNTDDVAAVYARIPVAGTTLGSLTGNLGSGSVTITGQPAMALDLQIDGAAASTVVLPPIPFAGATLSSPVWAGYIQSNPGGAKIATFQVFTLGSFHYLATKYNLTDAVKVNRGHTTVLTTSALSAVATGTEAEIMMVSRNGNWVVSRKTL